MPKLSFEPYLCCNDLQETVDTGGLNAMFALNHSFRRVMLPMKPGVALKDFSYCPFCGSRIAPRPPLKYMHAPRTNYSPNKHS